MVLNRIKSVLIILFVVPVALLSQGRLYEGPEDPASDISAVRAGYMNGNRAIIYFENTTKIGDWKSGRPLLSKWPNSYEGTQMIDNIAILVGGEVYVIQDSIPVTEPSDIEYYASAGELDTLFYVQTGYNHDKVDYNYYKTMGWQLYPVPGYVNETQDFVAVSTKPDSWPYDGWPSTGFNKKWQGEWNGRFGRGVHYADLESYFVANDAHDLEYIVQRNDPEEKLITEEPRYYPRPGKFIGDINPDVTVQKGYPWGGLGLRIATRGYQWNNPEAKDIVFWEYEVSNISDYDLPKCGLGFNLDLEIGGHSGGNDDYGYYEKDLDIAYAWDHDGIGAGGLEPGVFAMAYLESPGRAYDDEDNDGDGLLNEKRDNKAGSKIGPVDGIHDLDKFLKFYSLKQEDLREHFEGDEDQDWDDGLDLNNNGTYAYQDIFGVWRLEPGEFAGDDVGLDGVAPGDLNYYGPDEGECNHQPDFIEGVGCEPDFAVTDVSESDMIGLTTFHVFDGGELSAYGWLPRDDIRMWKLMDSQNFWEYKQKQIYYFVFASTSFPFYKGRTERFSMGMLHAYENLASLESSSHSAPNMFRVKRIAQIIYERDYRFASAPLMPTLTATPSDGKVILTWDDVSDKLTREPFLENENDFAGYKIYRATDKLMSDPEIITDGKGSEMFKKPIFQCDKIDSLEGYVDFGLVAGRAFYLGDESGLTHYFIDENVENGKTYYYALVAYDRGIRDVAGGLAPAENNVVIELDDSEQIIRMGKNVAVVTPHQAAAGYDAPEIASISADTYGSGDVSVHVVDRNVVRADHTYKIKFKVDTLGYARKNKALRHHSDFVHVNNGLEVYDVTDNNRLVYEEDLSFFPEENILTDGETKVEDNFNKINYSYYRTDKPISSDIFDGLQIRMENFAELGDLDEAKSGWITGNTPINITPSKYESHGFPDTYDIVFTGEGNGHTGLVSRKSYLFGLNGSSGFQVGSSFVQFEYLLGQSFPFYVVNKSIVDSSGNYERCDILVEDVNHNGSLDWLEDRFLVGHYITRGPYTYWCSTIFGFDFHNVSDEVNLPKSDDVYRVEFRRPFTEADSIEFTVKGAEKIVKVDLDEEMENIKVVPNPYIMSNSMESAVGNKYLNQRRRILFTHIPAQCEIRIFTSSGVLVDKLDIDNEPSNGTVHWDLLSHEDLEVAAGMYVYHIKSLATGKEKIGKFALIK